MSKYDRLIVSNIWTTRYIVLVFPATAMVAGIVSVEGQDRGVRPADVTAMKGQQVTFNCSGSQVSWLRAPRRKIFTSPGTWNSPKGTKYDVIGSYNLVIKDLDPSSDGGTYKCDTDEVSTHLVTANLVVLGRPHVTSIYRLQHSLEWIMRV